jgi:hypothetical protein
MLVFDTETRVDATQALTFGSARLYRENRCLEEWIFYGDDLPDQDRRTLEEFVATHRADTVSEGCPELKLLTRLEFVKKLFVAAYKCRYLLVAFNFNFDVSRIAWDFGYGRKKFAGGFTFHLKSYVDKHGTEQPTRHRPSIRVKKIDSKRSIKGFTDRMKPDEPDLIPEDSETGQPDSKYIFPGHFLDVRTLAFALTNESHSLKSACKAFSVEHEKLETGTHGIVTPEYIEYNRRDVLATSELALKLLEEFEKHPIDLAPTMAYSSASIGKAYLRKMGIRPILERQPKFPKQYLGRAQSAFFGGRTSAHIRKVPVPVVYCDFLSMYPTVIVNMELRRFMTAEKITVVKKCRTEIQHFLEDLKPTDLFKRDTWKHMAAFVRVIPDGDILPCRAKYSIETNDWQVGVNYVYGTPGDLEHALWYSLPDIVASVILTGKVPKIVDAFRLEAVGTLSNLEQVRLRERVPVDPRSQDFFKVTIEERKGVSRRTDIPETEKGWLDTSLKCLSNSTGFGIYGQMNRLESEQKVSVTCYGIHGKPYKCRVVNPENPGEFCFPPLASLITGGARLMLALLEYRVGELGGTYAMEDTDSMAIVATESGGLVSCPGGPHRTENGKPAVKALSFAQVWEISESFRALSPYDPNAIPESVLKIEKDNFHPKTGEQRQIYCLAISAKRYVLYVLDETGAPILLRYGVNNKEDKWSEHGLGHLKNPEKPDDRTWIGKVWENIVRETHGFSVEPLSFEDFPAVGQIPISSPQIMERFKGLNAGKRYTDQIKPFNFLDTCHVRRLGHPLGTNPEEFHLIAPSESNSNRWCKVDWIDRYSGKTYRITTQGDHGTRSTARVKTYGDVIREYAFHPESKCADSEGNVCDKETIGLLQRRHIQIGYVKGIGKETNNLDDVEAGVLHSEDKVYTDYTDPQHDEWETIILPALRRTPVNDILKILPKSRRMIMYARAGKRPHRKNQQLIVVALRQLGVS